MSDLIDRQAAIDALKRAEALTRAFGYHNVIETIRELPTIDSVKHGRWEMGGGYLFPNWTCSRCKCIFCGTEEFPKKYKFCPQCGTSMDEE